MIIDCQLRWLTTQYGQRHFFQFGALGGATPDEYLNGGRRVEQYLARYHSHRRRWQAPEITGESAEAEWGFEPALGKDIEAFAQRHGFNVRWLRFKNPDDMSPLVADFYRHWNKKRRIRDNRLLVESFILAEPYWTIRTGSVPFWMVFNKEPSAEALEAYLTQVDSFEEIFMMLFSHGVEPSAWSQLLSGGAFLTGRHRGDFVGVTERAYPRDFGVFVRYYFDVLRKIKPRYPASSVTLAELDEFIGQRNAYRVEWHPAAPPHAEFQGASS